MQIDNKAMLEEAIRRITKHELNQETMDVVTKEHLYGCGVLCDDFGKLRMIAALLDILHCTNTEIAMLEASYKHDTTT